MKHRMALMGLLLAAVALSGCHTLRKLGGSCHDPQPYQKAQSIAPLQIPAGLEAPDTSNALKIPKLNEPALPPRKATDPCLDEPPSFQVPKAKEPQA